MGMCCLCVEGGVKPGRTPVCVPARPGCRRLHASPPAHLPPSRRRGPWHSHCRHHRCGGQQRRGAGGHQLARLAAQLQVPRPIVSARAPPAPPPPRTGGGEGRGWGSCAQQQASQRMPRCVAAAARGHAGQAGRHPRLILRPPAPSHTPPPPPFPPLFASLYGSVYAELNCMTKCAAAGANVISASYGGWYYSQAEWDGINALRQAGIIFVASAGNGESGGHCALIWVCAPQQCGLGRPSYSPRPLPHPTTPRWRRPGSHGALHPQLPLLLSRSPKSCGGGGNHPSR